MICTTCDDTRTEAGEVPCCNGYACGCGGGSVYVERECRACPPIHDQPAEPVRCF